MAEDKPKRDWRQDQSPAVPEPDRAMWATVGPYRIGAIRQDFLNARWVLVVDGPGFMVSSSAPSREAAMLKAEQIVDQQIDVYGEAKTQSGESP